MEEVHNFLHWSQETCSFLSATAPPLSPLSLHEPRSRWSRHRFALQGLEAKEESRRAKEESERVKEPVKGRVARSGEEGGEFYFCILFFVCVCVFLCVCFLL